MSSRPDAGWRRHPHEPTFKSRREYNKWYYQNYGKYGKKKGYQKWRNDMTDRTNRYSAIRDFSRIGSMSNPVARSSIAVGTLIGKGVIEGTKAVKKSSFGKSVSSITRKAKKKGHKIYNRIRKLF